MKQEIEKLFQQEMTRREFLQYVGSAVLLMLGFSAILRAFKVGPKESNVKGYGASMYGGVRR